MPQKTITETTPPTPKTLPQKIELTEAPKPKQPEHKPIPPELKIILDAFEEFEGILYAARNKIWQLYGPVDYQVQNSTGKHHTLEDIRTSFPEEMEAKLDFFEKEDRIIIKAKQFLGTDTFAKIASAVRGMGGQYISAGKDSHFEIRKF
jgi:hypothetical protein